MEVHRGLAIPTFFVQHKPGSDRHAGAQREQPRQRRTNIARQPLTGTRARRISRPPRKPRARQREQLETRQPDRDTDRRMEDHRVQAAEELKDGFHSQSVVDNPAKMGEAMGAVRSFRTLRIRSFRSAKPLSDRPDKVLRMLIIHGTKVRRSARGIVTAFCPICRLPTQHEVATVTRAAHLYFVSLGRGSAIGDETVCTGCGSVFGAPPHAVHVNPFSPAAVEDAIAMPPAHEVSRINRRLEVEERLVSGALSPHERITLIAEPFASLDYEFRSTLHRRSRESVIAVSVLLFIGLAIAAAILWAEVPNGPTRRLPAAQNTLIAFLACAAAAALSLIMCIYLIATQKRHAASKYMLDRLVISLMPLRPTLQELEEATHSLARTRGSLAACVKPADIVQRIG
jgi:hypothetical protein